MVTTTNSPLTRGADVIDPGNNEEPVRALVAAFSDALARRDARAFSMVFHHGADFTNVWGVTAHGRQAIEEFHRPILQGDGAGTIPSFKHADFHITETSIRFLRDDTACLDLIWHQSGAVQNGYDMGLRHGLLMLVVTKEVDRWGIAVLHNMDLQIRVEPKQTLRATRPRSMRRIR